jgi:hypothetical protein
MRVWFWDEGLVLGGVFWVWFFWMGWEDVASGI